MLKPYLARVRTNIPGWRTRRKIVVIESDDWGSIRMPSREVYQKCLEAGYPVDTSEYERYDSIASEEDLENLFDLLLSHRDSKGSSPVITANCLVANPDFEKIRASDFKSYHYELITETFKKYPAHHNNFNLWLKGMEAGIFHPQFHGREHLNVSMFMAALREGNKDALFGFEHGMPGSIPSGTSSKGNYFVGATRFDTWEDKEDKLRIFLEGLELFKELFGYSSESIIPTNYTWSPDFNSAVKQLGVNFLQGIRQVREPVPGEKDRFYDVHLGKKNELGQIFMVRNTLFEPSLFKMGIKDPVGRCLSEIGIAFRMQKPAVISSHRINYAGFIEAGNRDRTLKMLDQILTRALKRWPDIEFMTTPQLGRLIRNKK